MKVSEASATETPYTPNAQCTFGAKVQRCKGPSLHLRCTCIKDATPAVPCGVKELPNVVLTPQGTAGV